MQSFAPTLLTLHSGIGCSQIDSQLATMVSDLGQSVLPKAHQGGHWVLSWGVTTVYFTFLRFRGLQTQDQGPDAALREPLSACPEGILRAREAAWSCVLPACRRHSEDWGDYMCLCAASLAFRTSRFQSHLGKNRGAHPGGLPTVDSQICRCWISPPFSTQKHSERFTE